MKKRCANCRYNCKECKRERKWVKALDKAEKKEMKRLVKMRGDTE